MASNIIGPDMASRLLLLPSQHGFRVFSFMSVFFCDFSSLILRQHVFRPSIRLTTSFHPFTVQLVRDNRNVLFKYFIFSQFSLVDTLTSFVFPDVYNLLNFKCNISQKYSWFLNAVLTLSLLSITYCISVTLSPDLWRHY